MPLRRVIYHFMFSNEPHYKDPQACTVDNNNNNREQILNTWCTTGTLLGSLHRLPHSVLTATACKGDTINSTVIFTEKEIDDIQILLIILITCLASGYMLSL